MSKPSLIHFPGALFHITSRGNNKEDIFLEERDFRRYLKNIDSCQRKAPFELYAFVLMPNHLHLLIQVKKHSIDKIMQVIQTGYTMYFNKRYNHIGHVFQGRYQSFLVDKETYLLELLRYIHLNPIRAGIVKTLGNYPWSSHQALLDPNNEFNKILDREAVLLNFSQDPKRQVKEYKEFVLAGEGSWEEIFPHVAWGQVIGSDKFIHKVEKKIKKTVRDGA